MWALSFSLQVLSPAAVVYQEVVQYVIAGGSPPDPPSPPYHRQADLTVQSLLLGLGIDLIGFLLRLSETVRRVTDKKTRPHGG